MFKLYSFFLLFILNFSNLYAQSPLIHSFDPLDNMPILEPTPSDYAGISPVEERGIEYRKYLAASVKISVNGASGSGTIIYYDSSKNLAYVASCGHLWSQGMMSAEEGKVRKITCKIIVWYHNNKKLDVPLSYNANLIFYSYISGQDTSLLTFSPDWEPEYFPIAPANYKYSPEKHAHSCGCDTGLEVAHYDIKMLGLSGPDLVTNENSPRPGRSGGGLMDDDGYYIGTCWGTQYRDGSGKGYFTPLEVIHRFWSQNGYGFLLDKKPGEAFARHIIIHDHSTKQKNKFTSNYILIPN
jgi:hypothetical protein